MVGASNAPQASSVGRTSLPLELGIAALMVRLILFIGGAAALAAITRHLLGAAARIVQRRQEFGGFNVVLLVLFAVAIMDGIGDIALDRPHELLVYMTCAVAVSLGQQILGTLWQPQHGLYWASLGAFVPPELTLFFIAVQLPIYILPVLLRPLYRRVDGRGATQ